MLSQNISPMVRRKGGQGRLLTPENLAQLGTSSHQLCYAPTHRGAALSEQGSAPEQLLGTIDSAMSYNSTERRSDPRAAGVAVQMIYTPFHTRPTIYRAALTEKNFQLLPDCIVSLPHQLYGQALVTELCPPKLRKPKPYHLARWHSFSPRAFQSLQPHRNALLFFTVEGSPPHHSLLSPPTSPTLRWAGRWSMAPGLLKCFLCHLSRHPLKAFHFKALDCNIKKCSCLSNKDYIALLTMEWSCI